jgi:hypothetical protein
MIMDKIHNSKKNFTIDCHHSVCMPKANGNKSTIENSLANIRKTSPSKKKQMYNKDMYEI